jgi:hypothetical protein
MDAKVDEEDTGAPGVLAGDEGHSLDDADRPHRVMSSRLPSGVATI